MFAKRGRASVGHAGCSRSLAIRLAYSLERRAGDDKPVEGGMLRAQYHLARFKMRIAGDLVDSGDRRTRHARLAQQFKPMFARPGGEVMVKDRLEFDVIRRALGVERK